MFLTVPPVPTLHYLLVHRVLDTLLADCELDQSLPGELVEGGGDDSLVSLL